VDLRRAFRLDASSVWVVTSADAGSPVGFTAVSVASVSLAPPILSFNVSRTSSSLATLLRSGRYAVHLLAADQEQTARRFAGPAGLRFADARTWTWDDDGLPRVRGALTRLSGAVLRLVEAGDSLLVLGEVDRSDEDDDGTASTTADLGVDRRLYRGADDPLLHHARAYTRPGPVPARLAGAVA
jgi:flavin reductase (DIM6/NTAB) family NADH-FMN oxidoreductase RutF